MAGPTIRDVAKRAGVSIATVSRVHRGSAPVTHRTRRRVERAIHDLRYTPSRLGRSLAERRHAALGIVFPDLAGPYFSEVIRGFEAEAADDEHGVLILTTHGREALANRIRDLAARTDGLLILGRTVSDHVIAELRAKGRPLVLLARPPVADADTIRTENTNAAEQLTRHLIEHGHVRMAFIGDVESSPDGAERHAGFVAAHRAAGLPDPAPAIASAYREHEGHAAARRALAATDADRPTALFCANDEIAMGAYTALSRAGVAPGREIALTGWDDIATARHLAPPLTTVRQPMAEMGARAARALADQIRYEADGGARRPIRELLLSQVVIRESCGCAAQEAHRTHYDT